MDLAAVETQQLQMEPLAAYDQVAQGGVKDHHLLVKALYLGDAGQRQPAPPVQRQLVGRLQGLFFVSVCHPAHPPASIGAVPWNMYTRPRGGYDTRMHRELRPSPGGMGAAGIGGIIGRIYNPLLQTHAPPLLAVGAHFICARTASPVCRRLAGNHSCPTGGHKVYSVIT